MSFEEREIFTDKQRFVAWELAYTTNRLYDGLIEHFGPEAIREVEDEARQDLGATAVSVLEVDYESLGELGRRFKDTVQFTQDKYASKENGPLESLESPIHEGEKEKEKEEKGNEGIPPRFRDSAERVIGLILENDGEIEAEKGRSKTPAGVILKSLDMERKTWDVLKQYIDRAGLVSYGKTDPKMNMVNTMSIELENIQAIAGLIEKGQLSTDILEPLQELKRRKLAEMMEETGGGFEMQDEPVAA